MEVERIDSSGMAKLVPHPAPDANKYTRGKLVAVGGSASYPGAICMASDSAMRSGAGYVEVYCAAETLPVIHAYNPNVVARSWEGFTVSSAGLGEVDARHPKACLIGSGFDSEQGQEGALVHEVVTAAVCPVVVDGGALGLLAADGGGSGSSPVGNGSKWAALRKTAGNPLVLTPHYGEAARLARPFGIAAPEDPRKSLEADADYACAISEAYGATVVLKGARTLVVQASCVSGAEPVALLMDEGPACLAKAGTGDVLAGIVSALLAQGMSELDACSLATMLHARAAQIAQSRLTDVSVCATDVASCIPEAVASFL